MTRLFASVRFFRPALARRLWAALGGLAICATVAARPEAPVRVAGSDLLGDPFAKALQAHANRETIGLELDFSGSRIGIEKLEAGAADIAFVLLAPDEKMPGGDWVATPVAYRIAVVAAPAHIGLSQLSFTQLDGFFGMSGPAGYTQWKDAGVTGAVAQLTVVTHVLAGREDALSTEIFRHIALRGARLKPAVQRHAARASLREKMAAEEGGLAVLPRLPSPDAAWRVLAIARADGEPAFGPTLENIHHGDYPLRWPVLLMHRKDAGPKILALLRFVWSDEAARALEEGSDCVPLPPAVRAEKR